MTWTMPRPVLQAVAGLLGLVALAAFATGILNAPERGRLPGERAAGKAAEGVEAINAPEATPLSQERIEGPPPVEKPANKVEPDEEVVDAGEAETAIPAPPAANTIKPAANAVAPEPTGNVTTLEEPPH